MSRRSSRAKSRLLIGWLVSLVGGIAGLYLSFYGDFPSGAAIVCTLGLLLVLVSIIGVLRSTGTVAPTKN